MSTPFEYGAMARTTVEHREDGYSYGAGMEFKHPDGELDPELSCVDCHNGGIQK